MPTTRLVRAGLLIGLVLALGACGGSAATTAPPATARPTTAPTAPVAAATSVPSPSATDDPIAAVYAYLGRGPAPAEEQLVIENTQGPYARVALVPTYGDGVWFFLQKSSVGGWFVLTSINMVAAPDLNAVRDLGVPEELLADLAGDAPAAADATVSIAFDPSISTPPEARIYLILLDDEGYIAADMPEQPAGESFAITAPPGRYAIYARSLRFEDISFYGLWDAASADSPALAVVELPAGQTVGPLFLLRAPDPCGDQFALPESPDQVFPATNSPDYRQRLNCP